MKRFLIASVAAVFGVGLLAGCTQEAREDYDKAGENISDAVSTDAEKTGDAIDNATDTAATTGAVKTALMEADDVDAEHINVETEGMNVRLVGTVDTEAEKTRAEEVARGAVDSGYTIVNELTVGSSTTDPTTNN